MSTGYFCTITPLGRPPIIVMLLDDPTWKVSEVGGWLDGTASAYIMPQDRQWLREADITFDGPYGAMYVGAVRHYDVTNRTLACVGQHTNAMVGKPSMGHFCVTDLSAWAESGLNDTNQNITHKITGMDTTTDDALTTIWNPLTVYPSGSFARWRYDSGETRTMYLSFSYKLPSSAFHLTVYPLTDGAYDNGELPRGNGVWSSDSGPENGATIMGSDDHGVSGTVHGLSVGSCRGLLLHMKADNAYTATNGTTYQINVYGVSIYAGGVAPRYDASDGLYALRASDVVSYLISQAPSRLVGGTDITNDLTVVEPFDAPGTRADQYAALSQIADGALWWEKRDGGPCWAVYKPRTGLPIVDLPAEDGVRVSWDASPSDSTAMCSALLVRYTDSHGTTRSYTAYDTDPTHYLVRCGRYQGGSFDPRWGPELDIGDGNATIAAKAASTFFAYTAGNVASKGDSPWTGTVALNGADPYPAYFTPGCIIRCQTLEQGVAMARARESDHTALTRANITLDNTANASDMMARAVEGLNRARAFTAARAIKTRIHSSAKVKKAIAKKVAAAKKKAAAAARKHKTTKK